MLFLSVFIVFAFIAEMTITSDEEIIKFLHTSDLVACLFLLIDVIWRWLASKHKWKFWLWGWIDLLSSIPAVNYFRLARVLTILRFIAYLRTLRSAVRIIDYFFADKVKSTMASAAVLLTGSVMFGGFLVLKFELEDPNATIHTAYDALWWAVNTITTVGSSDYYPITTGGRTVAMIVMFVGITLFGTCSALLTNWLIQTQKLRRSHFSPDGLLHLERPGSDPKADAIAEAKNLAVDAAQAMAEAKAVQAEKAAADAKIAMAEAKEASEAANKAADKASAEEAAADKHSGEDHTP